LIINILYSTAIIHLFVPNSQTLSKNECKTKLLGLCVHYAISKNNIKILAANSNKTSPVMG